MSWATKRKLIYLFGFIVVFCIVVALPAYFLFRRTATCSDGIQNQGETGVDCGGPCVNLCNSEELTPVILWSRAFQVLPGIYSATAYIENPNLKATSVSVPYTFTFYSPTNAALATRSGTVDIPAGQSFAVFESNISLPASTTVRTDFQFTKPIVWQIAPTVPQLNTVKIVISYKNEPSVEADIVNPSFMTLPRVDVTAIVYDAAGNAFAASKTYVANLGPQSSAHVVFTWPEPFIEPVARAELIPVINEHAR